MGYKNREVFYTHSTKEGGATIVAYCIRGTMEKLFGGAVGGLFDDDASPAPYEDGACYSITIERMDE